jgi:hypothetical protein
MEWINVDDKLPDNRSVLLLPQRDKWVLVDTYWTYSKCPEPAHCDINGDWWIWLAGDIVKTTKIRHWMPLPKRPK